MRPLTTRTAMAVTRRAGIKDRYAGKDKTENVIRLGINADDSKKAIEALHAEWPDTRIEYEIIGSTLNIYL